MKLVMVALAATALVVATAGLVGAQDLTGKVAFLPEVGVLIPLGDFGSNDSTSDTDLDAGYAKTGYGFGGSLEYYASPNIALGGKFFYNRFGFDTKDFEAGAPEIDWDAHWKVIQFGAYLKYLFGTDTTTRVFGRAGVIFGSPEASISGSYGGVSADVDLEVDSAVGFDVGLGLMHMTSDNIAICGGVDLNMLSTDGKDVTLSAAGETLTAETVFNSMWLGLKVCGVFLF
jgi:hypothetical protein